MKCFAAVLAAVLLIVIAVPAGAAKTDKEKLLAKIKKFKTDNFDATPGKFVCLCQAGVNENRVGIPISLDQDVTKAPLVSCSIPKYAQDGSFLEYIEACRPFMILPK